MLGLRISFSNHSSISVFQHEQTTMVACGWRHTIVVAKSGAMYTFGWSKYGQLGHGNEEDQLVPHRVEALQEHTIRQVRGLECRADKTCVPTLFRVTIFGREGGQVAKHA